MRRFDFVLIFLIVIISCIFIQEKLDNERQIKQLQDEIKNNKDYAEVFLHAHGWSIAQLRYEHDVLKRERDAKERVRQLAEKMGNIQ